VSTSQQTDRRRYFAIIVALAVVAAACVHPDAPKVAINKLEANLVFGVKPDAPVVQPTAQATAQNVVDNSALLSEPAAIKFDIPQSTAPFFASLPTQVVSDCPDAPLSAAADVPADVNINGTPPVGLYRWKRDGKLTSKTGVVTTAQRTFEKRIVRNYQKVSDTQFTYETVAPVPGSSLIAVSSYKVNTAAVSKNANPGYDQIATVPSVGDPERGVVLAKVDYQNSQGQSQGTFVPTKGLLLLPLPVNTGEDYKSVAVDPKGQTIVLEATVVRRGRIDACGKLVDGWLVHGTETITGAPGSVPPKYDYTFIIAPQYGGVLINEHVIADTADGGKVDLDFTQGQLGPDPLPAGA